MPNDNRVIMSNRRGWAKPPPPCTLRDTGRKQVAVIAFRHPFALFIIPLCLFPCLPSCIPPKPRTLRRSNMQKQREPLWHLYAPCVSHSLFSAMQVLPDWGTTCACMASIGALRQPGIEEEKEPSQEEEDSVALTDQESERAWRRGRRWHADGGDTDSQTVQEGSKEGAVTGVYEPLTFIK